MNFNQSWPPPDGGKYPGNTIAGCEAVQVQCQDRPVQVAREDRWAGWLFYFCVAAGEASTSEKCLNLLKGA